MPEFFWQAFAVMAVPWAVAVGLGLILRGTRESVAESLRITNQDREDWPHYSHAFWSAVVWFVLGVPALASLMGLVW